ncbi:lysocardiolipin acyltransferase 1-like [Leptopilina heterotoma]|uniref:lysocardiolipin acyltransferase 1-like n=1 Tax=Leptopilina heterotoma TaxID=63436 RepID=UPI001CA8D61A|nr:lysocardiolipin acyltransferase 1-like [Leptopilina heterotoma]
MRGLFRGIIYCSLWYGSIVAGFLFIACPLLPLMFISPPKFRRYGDLLFSCWELYPAALMELLGMKIVVSGDHISPDDSAILVMNHRTRVDWNFLWGAMYQACLPHIAAHKLKFILKDPIRHIPGPGWIMQMNSFLYITRRWEVDQGRLSRSLDYLIDLRRRTQLLIFPEGTDLTRSSREKSDKYAAEHGLPTYNYTLHPKTTGFTYLARHLQKSNYLDSVYDLTIGYPDRIPQSEIDLVTGKMPDEIHFHVKRIDISDLPENEVHLRNWLEKRWLLKEEILKQFAEKKSFSDVPWPKPSQLPLRIALVFWTLLTGSAILLILTSSFFRFWTILHVLIFICLSLFSSGFSELEMGWYWHWKRKFTEASPKEINNKT